MGLTEVPSKISHRVYTFMWDNGSWLLQGMINGSNLHVNHKMKMYGDKYMKYKIPWEEERKIGDIVSYGYTCCLKRSRTSMNYIESVLLRWNKRFPKGYEIPTALTFPNENNSRVRMSSTIFFCTTGFWKLNGNWPFWYLFGWKYVDFLHPRAFWSN